MISFFSTIISSLGFVNLSVTIKNRIYLLIGGIGNFYLLYVALRFFQNGYYWRGGLFVLAFIALLYFTYINCLYYFTNDKSTKYDISPYLYKLLRIEMKDTQSDKTSPVQAGFVQTNGIFKDQEFLPATIRTSIEQQINLKQVVSQMRQSGYFTESFGGMSDRQIQKAIIEGKTVSEIQTPVALPYFELKKEPTRLVVLGGLNQMERKEIAFVETVGLLPASEAMIKYHLYLATVTVLGGPVKVSGRSGLFDKDEPYELNIQVAYRHRGQHRNSATLNRASDDNNMSEQPLRRRR